MPCEPKRSPAIRRMIASMSDFSSLTVFESAFKKFGLPAAMRTDNGAPFASPNALCNLSRLSVWSLNRPYSQRGYYRPTEEAYQSHGTYLAWHALALVGGGCFRSVRSPMKASMTILGSIGCRSTGSRAKTGRASSQMIQIQRQPSCRRPGVTGHEHDCLSMPFPERRRYRILDNSAVIRFAV